MLREGATVADDGHSTLQSARALSCFESTQPMELVSIQRSDQVKTKKSRPLAPASAPEALSRVMPRRVALVLVLRSVTVAAAPPQPAAASTA